ncbi:DUF4136 domain-containing protein [candidate division KSB1 bacterium]|nr:DUF4136 domain-containing protein [candidate division KSB1 bacterium]
MKKKILTLILLIAFVTMGCSSMKVVVDYDDQINFSKYRTFNFVSPKKVAKKKAKNPAVIKDPLLIKKAAREISAVLTEAGFQKSESPRQADFLIAFYATARNKAQISPPSYHIGRYGRRWVRPGHVYHYKQGTLIIDIVDRQKKELVWRGVGSGALDRSDPKKNLLEAVEKILKEFPPME